MHIEACSPQLKMTKVRHGISTDKVAVVSHLPQARDSMQGRSSSTHFSALII